MLLLPLLAGPNLLVQAADSTDALARDRGAYALARAYDPGDTTEAALVQHLYEAGEADQRDAVVRGILARHWSSGRPSWFDAQLPRLLLQHKVDPAQVLLLVPHDDAVEMVQKDRSDREVTSSDSLAPYAWMLGDDDLRAEVALYARFKGADHLVGEGGSIGGCSLEHCLDLFATMAWLHMDLKRLYESYDGREHLPTVENGFLIDRVKAAGGDGDALRRLVDAAHTYPDAIWRMKLLNWIYTTPRAPNPAVYGLCVDILHGDLDWRVRARAAGILSAAVGRGDAPSGLEAALLGALRDGNVDVRVEAAAGLAAVHVSRPEMRELAKSELDPAVRALLSR